MTKPTTLTFDQKDAIATITLNRPEAANGINLTMADELLEAANYVAGNPDIRAVILTAEGKMFSGGGDLKSFAEEGDNLTLTVSKLLESLNAAISVFANMPKPLIIAVNGTAAGAGFSLACIGDVVIAANTAKFTMAYSAAGLTPDAGASFYLPRLVGVRKAQQLMMDNTLLTAQNALDLGILSQVTEADQLMETALYHARQYAYGPTKAYATIKQLINNSLNQPLEAQLALEGKGMLASMETHDGKEGISAFIEKRRPDFIGR
ncbi:MAG: enoyl-CoA hydratase-related protein [Cellvibrionales bacterium]|nr:enoyl-CoA hydratase-related protein [Cellvibrionales bacterium]